MRYATIVWDWNGTLLDDVSLAISVINKMLSEHGLAKINNAVYTELFEFPVQKYYENLGFDLTTGNFSELSDRFCGDFEDGLGEAILFPRTKETLAELADLRHFVLSNTEQTALDRMLQAFDIGPCFEAARGLSNNHAAGKVGIGNDLLNEHQIDRSSAVLIGDTIHDAEVADALGIDCLLVATGHNSRARLEALGVPVIDSLQDIHRFIV